ncbi:hypothetical protein LOTGIDRAFT_231915 [Lottia gigantea]|uniref:FAD-binding PCMH-type domain-containing protein n=1 Tax=Lottia gigantea TaxID=225164 RepID=V4APX1_LOTGI|nr:hypothetical protein LOTGIDRAFT_231915 [Lottia gigantea]ESO95691.1 hypothetical protein LOTGIDRAFT_231915 [Lottia gigantea]
MSLKANDLGFVNCPVCRARHIPAPSNLSNGVYAADCLNCGHFFKFRTTQPVRSSFSFKINGQDVTVGNEFEPTTSLNEFLRKKGISYGTKKMCIEGGCGVCVVSAKIVDALTLQPRHYTVNSCIVPVYMCDGWEITTIEGLGNTRDGIHPIQQRLADYNGTQCGFCSPAQVMNMYSLLQTNPKPSKEEVEDMLNVSVCRCTGFRSILDAMKSFTPDSCSNGLPTGLIDIEELDGKICKKTGEKCQGKCSTTNEANKMLQIVTAGAQWFKPTTKQELYSLLAQYKTQKYRLVFGNSAYGVYKDLGDWNYDVIIDLRGVQEYYSLITGSSGTTIGSNMTLTNLLEYFTSQQTSDPALKQFYDSICQHLDLVATTSVRNLGTWAGNLMMKYYHPEFVSDIYVIFEAINAQLVIADETGKESSYSISEFLALDMTGKVIVMAKIPSFNGTSNIIRTIKTMPRHQNAHTYVSAGFNMNIDAGQNYKVLTKPTIVYVGINKTFTHASQTEDYLVGKSLGDSTVLNGALQTLAKELIPDAETSLTPASYRKSVAISLFYKYVLGVCDSIVNKKYQSGSAGLTRPVSSGQQTFDSLPAEFPVSKAIPKVDGTLQTTGEAEYISDTPPQPNEVYAAYVISSVANAEIDSMDASLALSMPGVLKFLTSKDIPQGGVNNCYPERLLVIEEEVFCSGKVIYAGQPLGLIVAEDQMQANIAAGLVQVTYKNMKTPILSIDGAIRAKSFFKPPDPLNVGDPDGAIAKSDQKINGQVYCGDQYHYQMETQISICYPTEDGMNILAGTQWIDGVQQSVGQVLGIPDSSIVVEVKRLGGAFGSKISRNFPISSACAVAAHILRRPVRLQLDFHTNMKMIGKRVPYLARYEVGCTNDGKLNGIKIDYYADCGTTPNDMSNFAMEGWLDNAYYCANWNMTPYNCRTNKPPNTAARSPGSAPAMFIIETIMEHVAKTLKQDPLELRRVNLYQKGQKTPGGTTLTYCNIQPMVTQLESSADIATRKQQIETFNSANRWKKRGMSVMPLRFGIGWAGAQYNTLVTICNGDGTIAIFHGGVNVGQGINTKVIQVCAYELGVPMDIIRVKKTSSVSNSNSITTGGSITSELICMTVIECCKALNARMAPVKAKMKNPKWKDLVAKCYGEGVDITARYMSEPKDSSPFAHYSVYGVCASEAELDVLTGEYQILRTDILYDCGISMNPALDIGQAEGGFVMGLGYFLLERTIYDPKTGVNLTSNTWEYHPPMYKDIPIDFRINFLKNVSNPLGVLGSKAVGEPPFCMAVTGLLAVKHAIEAARKEINKDMYFTLNAPATVNVIQGNCLTDVTDLTFGN